MVAVFLQWENTDVGNTDDVNVYREATNGPWVTPIAVLAPTVDLYEDDAPAGTWWYRVAAKNAEGESTDEGTNIEQITVGSAMIMGDAFGGTDGDAIEGRVPDQQQYLTEVWTEYGGTGRYEIQSNTVVAGGSGRNDNIQYVLPSADFKSMALVSRTSSNVRIIGRNTVTSTASKATWEVSVPGNNIRIFEDGVERARTNFNDGSLGTIEATFDGQTITGVWNSVSDTDETVQYALATQNELVANTGAGTSSTLNSIDDFRVDPL